MRFPRVPIRFRRVSVLLALFPATVASAQWSGDATLASDYRYRGVSLSDDRASPQIAVAFDGADGGYGGASLTSVALLSDRRRGQWLGYGGYAARGESLSWEIGGLGLHFDGASRFDYVEAYAGLIGGDWNARVYVSPDYFGTRDRTAYLELNGGMPISAGLRLFVHAGSLVYLGRHADDGNAASRFDGRLGAGFSVDALDLQLAWIGIDRLPAPTGRRQSLVFSVSYGF